MKIRPLSRLIAYAMLAAVGLMGCRSLTGADRDGELIRRGAGQQDIRMVGDRNAAMNAAIAKARSTVPGFITALQNPAPTQTNFTVKLRVTDGKVGEHMWLNHLTYDGSLFQGQLVDDPYQVAGYHKGQSVSVAPSEISDWIFFDNNEIRGGFTEKVIEAMEQKGG